MALTTAELLRQQALDLDYDDVKELLSQAGLKGDIDTLSLDWTQKQINIDTLAGSSTSTEKQVALNVIAIGVNAQDLADHISDLIGAHAASAISYDGTTSFLVAINVQDAIDETVGDLDAHTSSTSAHGAGGDIVGTTDFATSILGGVVLEATNVSDAVQSTVTVTSPDATAAPAVYDQTDAQTAVTLVNELKLDLNQAITDFNAVTVQLNAFLAANQTAGQMA